MEYRKIFDVQGTQAVLDQYVAGKKLKPADRRDGLVYLYTDQIELTVNVAMATGRPILLRGASGSGKSSLAKNVALRMKRRYYEEVITSKTQHTDLQWRFDLLRRFRDAQTNSLKQDADYLEPRSLWWAFDAETAVSRGLRTPLKPKEPAKDPSEFPGDGAVVLIDEIDKADPDVPNNLLVALGSLQFTVPYVADLRVETESAPLVFITSNDERELPAAFLRRCIVLELKAPKVGRLVEIAVEHFGGAEKNRRVYSSVADTLYPRSPDGKEPETSTAEYLDAVRACMDLQVQPKAGDEVWDTIVRTTVRKAGAPGDIRA